MGIFKGQGQRKIDPARSKKVTKVINKVGYSIALTMIICFLVSWGYWIVLLIFIFIVLFYPLHKYFKVIKNE